jgi:hypothetical protein
MDKLLELLKGAAPALATVVAGPMGGIAVKAIAEKFGVADEVGAVAEAIAGDPAAAQKLAEIDLQKLEMEYADRANARAMQIAALQQDNPEAKNFIYRFAWFWSFTSVLYFFCVTFAPLPDGGRDFANIILGFLLGTAVANILSFFYGSSKSSQDKTSALTKGGK